MEHTLIQQDEEGRIAAVRRYEILDTPPERAFDRITALAARLFDAPIAMVSIVDSDRIWFKSHHGIAANQTGRDPGLCASAILGAAPWVVEDAQVDPRTLANPLVTGDLGLRFYAGAPLVTGDGHRLGTLCVIDREPREFTDDQAALLAELAAVVVDELELRLASRRAVEPEHDLRTRAERMARALQQSVLPPDLPGIPGARLAALYQPADAGVVGGDFYDIFQAAKDTWVLVVGDVSGKGADAAVDAALVRHTIRTASLSASSPADVLGTLNRALLVDRRGVEIDHVCTAMIVWASAARGGLSLRAAGAGHPPALIRRADGSADWLETVGAPAGWFLGAAYDEHAGRLGAGDALVVFTDGMTEARTAAGMLGADGLERALVDTGTAASSIAGALRELIASDEIDVRDDVAVLVLEAT